MSVKIRPCLKKNKGEKGMIRREISSDEEEKIIAGLIVSDKICRDTIKLIKNDTFQNLYAQKIAGWIIDYYKTYKKAPKKTIQDIYRTEIDNIRDKDEIDIIGSMVSKISESIDSGEKLNEDYLIDKAVEYCKKRSLKSIAEKIESYLERGKLVEAERTLQSYRQVSKDSSKFIDPFSDESVRKFFEDEANNANALFRMPGALGNLIGDFERGTLVGIMAPTKRGKSFLMTEIGLEGFFERYKVLDISLEMNQYKMERRLLRRITAFGEENKEYIYPCFDCYKNQINSCDKPIRRSRCGIREKIGDEYGEKPMVLDVSLPYTPCSECRGTSDFIPESWFTLIRRPKKSLLSTRKVVKGIRQMYSDNFRLVCYPKFSANVSDIKADIDRLEQEEDFIPDVIIVDYADILKPEDSRVTGRDRYDETWKMLGNLADTRKALVVTGSQTNKASADKKFVTQTDVSEDWRKVANVDVMISLNQTPEEKRQGVMRVAVVAGRDDEFDQFKNCTILQNLALGQVCLDSEMNILKRSDTNKKEKIKRRS